MLDVGTTIKIIREPPYPEYNVKVGDIGVVTYASKTLKYSVYIPGKYNPHEDKNRIYGNPGDFWISKNDVTPYKFKVGDRVVVVSDKSRYKGKTGTIKNNSIGYNNYLGILLDDYPNHKEFASYDIKLCKTSVRLIDCNEINIRREENIMKLTGYNKVAGIEIAGCNYYYALYDDFSVGDNVLVTGRCDNKILTIKEIITKEAIKEIYSKDITEEVKCKVDLSAYETRVENRKKAEKLRKEMDKKIAEMDEMNKYVLYAEKNDELAKMLEEYRELV